MTANSSKRGVIVHTKQVMTTREAKKHYDAKIRYYLGLGWKLGYKVVSQTMSTLEAPRSGALLFGIGKTTRPKPGCGPIAVFLPRINMLSSYQDALCLARPKALLVVYKPSKLKSNFVKYGNSIQLGFHISRMYAGTRLADKVHVIAEVEIHE